MFRLFALLSCFAWFVAHAVERPNDPLNSVHQVSLGSSEVADDSGLLELVEFDANGEVISAVKTFPPCAARDMAACGATHRSFKLVEMLETSVKIDTLIGNILDDSNWAKHHNLEGNSLWFFHKIKILQEAAADPRVETICEIGTNSGYSAANFLISNPRAKLISFDLYAHVYTGAAVRAIQAHLFPARSTAFISGNSSISVPSAAPLLASQKCNLIFIDGSHHSWDVRADIDNMRALANETYNRVIVDDLDLREPREEWLATPMMKNFYTVVASGFTDIQYLFNETTFSYDFQLGSPYYASMMGLSEYVF
jgi:hypothetical protein